MRKEHLVVFLFLFLSFPFRSFFYRWHKSHFEEKGPEIAAKFLTEKRREKKNHKVQTVFIRMLKLVAAAPKREDLRSKPNCLFRRRRANEQTESRAITVFRLFK